MLNARLIVLGLLLFTIGMIYGCDCGDEALSGEGGPCKKDSDCKEGLYCSNGKCVKGITLWDSGYADGGLDAISDGGKDGGRDAGKDGGRDVGGDIEDIYDGSGEEDSADVFQDVEDLIDSGEEDVSADILQDVSIDVEELEDVTGQDGGMGVVLNCPNKYSPNKQEKIEFSSDNPDAEFMCKLDKGLFEACTSPYIAPNDGSDLPEGQHTFVLKVVINGVPDPEQPSCEWTTDYTPPETSLTPDPSNSCGSKMASFTFDCTDNSKPCQFECELDNKGRKECNSPIEFSDGDITEDGNHTLKVWSKDIAGNEDPSPAEYSWILDTTPPDTRIVDMPSNPTSDTNATFKYESTEPKSTFECQIDGAGWMSCDSEMSFQVEAGEHTFEVRAVDQCGNKDPEPADYKWLVDTDLPLVKIKSHPEIYTSLTDAVFEFICEHKTGCTTQCQLDNSPLEACSSPISYPNLSEGKHTFKVIGKAGNGKEAEDEFSWHIDITPPEISLSDTGLPDKCSTSSNVSFNFSCLDSGVDCSICKIECKLNSGQWEECTSPKIYNSLADNFYTFSLRCTDPAGNTGGEKTYEWRIDTIPCETTITSYDPSISPTNQNYKLLEFSSSESSRFQCKLDTGNYIDCASPKRFENISGDGAHTVYVKCIDECGNEDKSPASHTWILDTTNPETRILSGPSDGQCVNSSVVNFEFVCEDVSTPCTYECSIDSSGWKSCNSPVGFSNLSEGDHTLSIRATDKAGNMDDLPAVRNFRVDTISPVVYIDKKPSQLSRDSNAVFEFHASEVVERFECQIDGGVWTSCTSPSSYVLTDGEHTFAVRALDKCGNTGTEERYTWKIDTVSCKTTLSQANLPQNPTNNQTATFIFTADKPSTFECTLDTVKVDCQSPMVYSNLSEGSHTFTVRCITLSGVPDPDPPSYTWRVDITPPETVIESNTPECNSTTPTFSFSSADSGSPCSSCIYECKIDTQDWVSCTSPRSYTSLTDGAHIFSVRAIDAAGNIDSTPAKQNWIKDTTPPDTVITGNPSNPSGFDIATFSFISSENNSSFECSIDSNPYSVCISPIVYTGLTDGSHIFRVRAKDACNNYDTTPAEYSWIVDTSGVDTEITSMPQGYTSSQTAEFAFKCNKNNCTFECKLEESGSWEACTSPKSFNNLSEGMHKFYVRAIYGGLPDSSPASYEWTIDRTPPETSITDKPPKLTKEGEALFKFSATDSSMPCDKCTFRCKVDSGNYYECTSPVLLSNLGNGEHTFSVYSVDRAGNEDSTPEVYIWTVDSIPPETFITSHPAEFTKDTSASFSFSCSEDGVFMCSIDLGNFENCNSPKTYSGLQEGIHIFKVKCADLAGNVDPTPAEWTWTIDLTPPDSSITSKDPSDSPTYQTSMTFTFQCTEPGGAECQLDNSGWSSCISPKTYSSISDGQHTVKVRCIDRAGNVDPTPADYTWVIDSCEPDTHITSLPLGCTKSRTVAFEFFYSGCPDGGSFECKLDSGNWANCTSPKTYSNLLDGTHTFYVRAVSSAGKPDSSPAQQTFSVDTVEPDTIISGKPSDYSNSQSAIFSFTESDTGCDNSTFECKVDNSGYLPCVSPKNYYSLPEGQHIFYVRATDSAGNTDQTPAQFVWIIDITPPDTNITTKPSQYSNTKNPTFAFECLDAYPDKFECKLDNGNWESCQSPVTYSGLSEGNHTFSVRCYDRANNADPTPASYTWYIDTIPPDTTIVSGPPQLPQCSSSTDATFTFTCADSGSGPLSYECKLDSGGYVSCNSPQTYTGLSYGNHQFFVRCIDKAGNTDPTSAYWLWTIDNTPPDTYIISGPSDPTNETESVFTFASSEANSTFLCQRDGGSWNSCSSPLKITGIGEGQHSLCVKAVDCGENKDPTPACWDWYVDLTPPDTINLTAAPSSQKTNSTTISFTFSCNEDHSTPCSYECSVDGSQWNPCSSPQSYSSLSDGSHLFKVRAKDKAGNVDPLPAEYSWIVDTRPPDTVSLTASVPPYPPNKTNIKNITFTFSAVDPEGSSEPCTDCTFECKLDSEAWQSCSSPKQYTNLPDGEHNFYVRATDGAGNLEFQPNSFKWYIDTIPCNTVITSTNPSTTPTKITTMTYYFTADETSTFECKLDNNNWIPCTSPYQYTNITPDGSHTVFVRCTDLAGNTDQTPAQYSWVIDTDQPDSKIDSYNPSQSPTNSNSISFVFSCYDPEFPTPCANCTAECKLDNGSYQTCVSPITYNGLSDGNRTFYVRCIDAAQNIDSSPATYSWVIDTILPDTRIDSAPPILTNSKSATFSFSAFDPPPSTPCPSCTFECSIDGGSWGSCTSPKTYLNLGDGEHRFSVRSRDTASNLDLTPAEYQWTIDTVQPETILTGGTYPNNRTRSTSATFTFIAEDPPGNSCPNCTFECSLDGSPWSACQSGITYNGLSYNCGNGGTLHTFSVRSIDLAGNIDGSPVTYQWTIDVCPPDTYINQHPDAYTKLQNATFGFYSDSPESTFECKLDSGSWVSCTSPRTYNGLTEGSHTFYVRAIDDVGNVDPTPVYFSWEIDITPCITSIITPWPYSYCSDPYITNSMTASFNFEAYDKGVLCTDCKFQCMIDGGSWEWCTPLKVYSNLSDAYHTFSVRCIDPADNVDPTPENHSWTVDTVSPDTEVVTGPNNPTNSTTASIQFASTEPPGSYKCRLDGGGWQSCSSPKVYTSLSNACHTFEVAAIDSACNEDPSPATYIWRVDTTNPNTILTSTPPSCTNVNISTFEFTCNESGQNICGGVDTGGCYFECQLDSSGWSLCSSPQQYTNLPNGSHTFYVRARDKANNYDNSPETYDWRIDTVAPNTIITQKPNNPSLVNTAYFEFQCTEQGTFECYFDGSGWEPCTSPKTYSSLSDGFHSFTTRCTDMCGNTDQTPENWTWEVTTWKFERASAPKYFDSYYPGSIKTDSLNLPHIVYGGDKLYYVKNSGTEWIYEVVDDSSGVGSYANLAISSTGKAHIVYWDRTNGDLKYANNEPGIWYKTVIDSSVNVGEYASIALDSTDKVHISYYDSTNGNLKYATNISGNFETMAIDTTGDVGLYTSIGIDSNNKVHISYYDKTNGDLKYATNRSGSWVTYTIDSSGDVGMFTSIGIDSNNKVHISYFDSTNLRLKYATDASGSWVIYIIDGTWGVGAYTSIGIDSFNKVHISYYDILNYYLKYATNISGAWVYSIIDNSGSVGLYTSLAIDNSNKVHISYHDGLYNRGLKYITNTTGTWSYVGLDTSLNTGLYTDIAKDSNGKMHISYHSETLFDGCISYSNRVYGSWIEMYSHCENSRDYGLFTSIAIDHSNYVYISFYDGINGDLKCLTNNGGSWGIIDIDSGGDVGRYSSIGIDSNNKVHISYYDVTNGDLKYATNVSGSWLTYTIDSTGDVGQYSSIGIDSNDRVHISYYDATNGNLKYATNVTGSWLTYTVDITGIVGWYSSIGIDSNNKVHISYYDATNGDLKYGTNAYGSWQVFSIDTEGIVGIYTGIVIDSNNKAHISYWDASMADLKYGNNVP